MATAEMSDSDGYDPLNVDSLLDDATERGNMEKWYILVGAAGLALGFFSTAIDAGEVAHGGREELATVEIIMDIGTLAVGFGGVMFALREGRQAVLLEAEAVVRERLLLAPLDEDDDLG